MWDLPRPGIKPVSPALAGRFLTTGPPGKSSLLLPLILSSQPNYLPKGPPLNTVPLEVPIQTYEFGGDNVQSLRRGKEVFRSREALVSLVRTNFGVIECRNLMAEQEKHWKVQDHNLSPALQNLLREKEKDGRAFL